MLGWLLRVLAAAAVAGALLTAPASGVVGGQTIQVQAAPWTVFVQQSAGSVRFLCTGSVVDASHVLTAAHCMFNGSCAPAAASAFQVRAGVSSYSAPLPTDLEQDRGVSAIRIHPGYACTGHPGPDDVAVLQLANPLDLSSAAVAAVTLPSANAGFPAGSSVGAAGFGLQQPTVTASGQLAWMTAIVDPQGACGDSSGGLISNNAIYLCATSATSAVCNGDSGSGLVTTGGGGSPVLVGVADATTNGCSPGSHSLFAWTGAPEILQFIQGNDHPPTAPRDTTSTYLRLGWVSSGPVYTGYTLTCSAGNWSDPAASITYSFVDTSSGRVLQSGPQDTLAVPASAIGATVSCHVAVANDGGTDLAATRATPPVRQAPPARIIRVAPVTAARGQPVSIRVTLVAPAGLQGKLAVCLQPPKVIAGRLCRSTVDGNGLGSTVPFVFNFRVKPTAPLGAARVSISAVAGQSTATSSTQIRVTG
jgi:hypothetical protein